MDKFLDTLKSGIDKVKDAIPGVGKDSNKDAPKDANQPAQPTTSTQPATTTRPVDAPAEEAKPAVTK